MKNPIRLRDKCALRRWQRRWLSLSAHFNQPLLLSHGWSLQIQLPRSRHRSLVLFFLCVLHVYDIDTHIHMLDEWNIMSNFAMSAGTHELPVSLFHWLESNLFQLHSCSTLLTNVGIAEGEQLEHAYAQWFVDVALGSFCFGLMGWWSRNNFRVPEASRCGRRERRNSGLSHVVQHLCFFF